MEVDYQRLPVAADNQLWLHGLGKGLHTVSGFNGDDILVIQRPRKSYSVLRKDIRIEPDGAGGWSVTFKAGKSPTDYLVVDRTAVKAP